MSIKKLRKVTDLVDKFQPEDHNDHVDNWQAQLQIDKNLAQNLNNDELQALISQLQSIISQMRKIVPGDFYFADDHNKFVDAWILQDKINKHITMIISPAKMDAIYVVPVAQIIYEYGNNWLAEETSLSQPAVEDTSSVFLHETVISPSPEIASDENAQYLSETVAWSQS